MIHTWKKQIVRSIIFWGLKGIAFISRLFPWSMGIAVGGKLGRLTFHLLSRQRKIAQANVAIAFGQEKSPEELDRIVRNNFENLGKGLMEILKMARLPSSGLDDLVIFEGEENLKRAYSQGKGVILISGHIGNWELMGAYLAHRGYPLHVIAAPMYDPRMDDWVTRSRAEFGVQTISRGTPSSSRKILSVLKKKEVLGLLIDQDTKVDGVFVDFFNRKAYTPSGAASLALRSDAPTLITYITRLSGNRHRLMMEGPVELVSTGDHSKDMVDNTALFTRAIENCIRRYPEQWVWMHRRWKTKAPREEGPRESA